MAAANKIYIVYLHTSPSGKRYVGITSQSTKNRWRSGKGYKKNDYFTSAINKYGWENFDHEILFGDLTESEASKKERELVELYKSDQKQFGYNLTSGGEQTFKPSDESRAKMRKPRSEQGKINMAKNHANVSGINNPMYGRKFSDEHRQKISEALTGRKLPEAQILKMQSRKGTVFSYSKKVIQMLPNGERVNEFDTITIAAEKTGCVRQHISKCCSGRRNKTGGFRWQYATVQEVNNAV